MLTAAQCQDIHRRESLTCKSSKSVTFIFELLRRGLLLQSGFTASLEYFSFISRLVFSSTVEISIEALSAEAFKSTFHYGLFLIHSGLFLILILILCCYPSVKNILSFITVIIKSS